MTAPSGISAQLTLAQEGTYGTYQTPTRALDLVSETLKQTIARIESKGLRAGRRVITSAQWVPGLQTNAGSVNLELGQVNFGLIWLHAMGGTAVTVNNADTSYTHTLIPGDLTGLGLTLQIGRPSIAGVVEPFSYCGCKINKWTLACKAGEIASLDLDIVAQSETTAQGLVNASGLYPAALKPLTFVGGLMKIAGTQVDIKEISLVGDNKLDANRAFLRNAATVKEPLENDIRDYTGTWTSDLIDLGAYGLYTAGTEAAMTLLFQGANIAGSHYFSTLITMNVRYDGDTPNVAGPATLEQPISFKAIASGGADSSAISVAYTTTDATP